MRLLEISPHVAIDPETVRSTSITSAYKGGRGETKVRICTQNGKEYYAGPFKDQSAAKKWLYSRFDVQPFSIEG